MALPTQNDFGIKRRGCLVPLDALHPSQDSLTKVANKPLAISTLIPKPEFQGPPHIFGPSRRAFSSRGPGPSCRMQGRPWATPRLQRREKHKWIDFKGSHQSTHQLLIWGFRFGFPPKSGLIVSWEATSTFQT